MAAPREGRAGLGPGKAAPSLLSFPGNCSLWSGSLTGEPPALISDRRPVLTAWLTVAVPSRLLLTDVGTPCAEGATRGRNWRLCGPTLGLSTSRGGPQLFAALCTGCQPPSGPQQEGPTRGHTQTHTRVCEDVGRHTLLPETSLWGEGQRATATLNSGPGLEGPRLLPTHSWGRLLAPSRLISLSKGLGQLGLALASSSSALWGLRRDFFWGLEDACRGGRGVRDRETQQEATRKPSPKGFLWAIQGRDPPPCILGAPWAGGGWEGGQPAGAEHTRSGHRPARPHCHCLPRAAGKAPGTCVPSARHRARQSPIPRQERRQEGWGACLGTEYNADTQRLPVCRRKVTSWSPGKARLRGTSGQVPGLLAPSGSSSRLAGSPSHGAEAQRGHLLPREACEGEGLGREASF